MKTNADINPISSRSDIVCFCRQVERATIEQSIAQGANTLETVTALTGAGSECGSCQIYIKELLGENLWQAVTLDSIYRYSKNYCAIRLRLADGGVWTREMPGSYFIFQAEIDGVWVGRPYAITDDGLESGIREITVKRKPNGFFSNWLFDHLDNLRSIPLRISACMGGSAFDPADTNPIVCLIGGVGITPVLALCRMLANNHHQSAIYVDYSATTEEDFFCREELLHIAQATNLNVNFRQTVTAGHIRQVDVDALLQRYPDRRFYICGPENYKSAVTALLYNSTAEPLQIIDLEASRPKNEQRLKVFDTNSSWAYRIVGLLLLMAYCLQDALGLKLVHLELLQGAFNYKIFSGLLLLSYILMQWRLPIVRWLNRDAEQLAAKRHSHKYFGAIAPLVFYLHATSVGTAYLAALSSIYLTNSFLGYGNGEIIVPRYRKAYLYGWTIMHVALSTSLLFLTAYHAYIALAYK